MSRLHLPLKGIRVLDLSRFVSGPWCALQLGDMGAEVIKVERPGTGDNARQCGPFHRDESLYYAMYNRNKKSIALDLRSSRGQEVFERLIVWADVVVENFRPGVLKKMGMPYERMQELNPRVVLVSISGFGQEGPFAGRPCFDTIAQAASGLMSMTGEPDGPPMITGVFLGDFLSGMYGALGAMLALFERERTNRGRHIDVAMLDSLVSLMETNFAEYKLTGRVPSRTGNRRLFAAPVGSFAARDGYVFINVSTDAQWQDLCNVIGREDLVADDRFATPFLRGENYQVIDEIVGQWVSLHDAQTAVDLLNRASVPASVVATVKDVMNNPQVQYRQTLREVEVPGVGGGSHA